MKIDSEGTEWAVLEQLLASPEDPAAAAVTAAAATLLLLLLLLPVEVRCYMFV